jgi:hypothetical protein
MANPMKGEAQLGDFTLTFNFGAFCSLEVKAGKKMPVLLQMLQEGLGFGELRDFAWAGLQAKHPGMTDEAVIDLVDEVGFEAAAVAIGKAVSEFFGSQKEKGKNPPKAA